MGHILVHYTTPGPQGLRLKILICAVRKYCWVPILYEPDAGNLLHKRKKYGGLHILLIKAHNTRWMLLLPSWPGSGILTQKYLIFTIVLRACSLRPLKLEVLLRKTRSFGIRLGIHIFSILTEMFLLKRRFSAQRFERAASFSLTFKNLTSEAWAPLYCWSVDPSHIEYLGQTVCGVALNCKELLCLG